MKSGRQGTILRIISEQSIETQNQLMDELKKRGVFILAADMGGEPAASVDFDLPCAIVIGAEGSGVSEGVRKAADRIISIPQKGRIQSLNASNAAAILLYEALRQRG